MSHCLGMIEAQAVCGAQTSRTPWDSRTPLQICNETAKQSFIVCMCVEKDVVHAKWYFRVSGDLLRSQFLHVISRHCRTCARQVYCNWSLRIEVAHWLVSILCNALSSKRLRKTKNIMADMEWTLNPFYSIDFATDLARTVVANQVEINSRVQQNWVPREIAK